MGILKPLGLFCLLGFLAIGMMSGCGASHKSNVTPTGPLAGKITVDGSATVFPLFQAMAAAFRDKNPGVQLDIQFSGTGGGFKKFCAGQVDITGASRPIKAAEGEQCKAQHVNYIEVPVAFDSLAVLVNPKNTFVDCLTVSELKSAWEPAAEGKVTQWKQVRASFPAQPLVLFGPGKAWGPLTISPWPSWVPKRVAGTITSRAKMIW